MARYSKEQKEAIKKRMMPPENMSIPKLSKETGITVTLCARIYVASP